MSTSPKGQFIWHELMTKDAKRALAFYSHVVGWKSRAMPMEGGGTYHVLEAEGRGMGGVMQVSKEQTDAGMRTGWVGYIGSPDVDADLERLKRLGGKAHAPAADIPQVGRFAPVSDPQGGGFLLFKPQPPPGPVPPRATGQGSVGWNELVTSDWKAAFKFYAELFGWTKAEAVDMGPMGTYQLFAAGEGAIGGMMNAPSPSMPVGWLYYFTVESVNAGIQRVKEKGGKVVNGPNEVPGPMWTVQCADPEGSAFALVASKP